MKSQMAIFLVMILCSSLSLRAASDDEAKWVKKYVVVRTTETVNRNTAGMVTSTTVVRESRISVRRRVTEVKAKDKHGAMRLVSRRTETYDSAGGSITVEEGRVKGREGLVAVSTVTVEKTDTGQITTTQRRKPNGTMGVVRCVTVSKSKDGTSTTTVAVPDKHGDLVVIQTTTSRSGVKKSK